MELMRRCCEGDIEAVKEIIAQEEINAADANGRTALIEAAWSGHLAIVKLLLSRGAEVNSADKSGFTALMRAAEEGYSSIASTLVKSGAQLNCCGKVRGTTPLILAAENGHLKTVEILINAGADINKCDIFEQTALSKASEAEKQPVVEFLQSKGARGKPERSSFSYADRESRTISKTALLHLSAASIDSDDDEDIYAN